MKATTESPQSSSLITISRSASGRSRERFPQPKEASRFSEKRLALLSILGGAVLLAGLGLAQLLSTAVTLFTLALLGAWAVYFYSLKPILEMDFDISLDNQELAEIHEDLWE